MSTQPLRLLIVEDEPAHVETIRRTVEAAFSGAEIRVAETLKQYRDACADRHPDIALMDLNLADGRALDVLTAPPESNPFPIVIMTSYGNEALAVEAMKAGALDYIVKSVQSFQAMAHTLERSLQQWALLRERQLAVASLEQQRNALEALLEENKILLRELYHRTKNNMQVITSMLSLQASHAQTPIAAVCKDMETRIRAMALVHEKLYKSSHLSRIVLSEYLAELTQLLQACYDVSPAKVRLTVNAPSLNVLIETGISLGLIVNELVSNALKYAFPGDRTGEISVRVDKTEQGAIDLYVSDNGVGLPPGYDTRKAETLGIKMLTQIVEYQMKGSVTFYNYKGVTCHVRIADTGYKERV